MMEQLTQFILGFADVVDQVRDYINRSRAERASGANGIVPREH